MRVAIQSYQDFLVDPHPPLMAGMIEISVPSATGVVSPPVERASLFPNDGYVTSAPKAFERGSHFTS
ncbi:MAG TPA: hypothetical protein VKE98_23280, partial [Gemmataceae bacterium]|nr:hypothetical protein [Gemmataceae bacterium]